MKRFYPRRLSVEDIERFLWSAWFTFVEPRKEGLPNDRELMWLRSEFKRLLEKEGVMEEVTFSGPFGG